VEPGRLKNSLACGGQHAHPSAHDPGGDDTVATLQLLAHYLLRLVGFLGSVKKVVPINVDVFTASKRTYLAMGTPATTVSCLGAGARSGIPSVAT
jgi:hypothetical protein